MLFGTTTFMVVDIALVRDGYPVFFPLVCWRPYPIFYTLIVTGGISKWEDTGDDRLLIDAVFPELRSHNVGR